MLHTRAHAGFSLPPTMDDAHGFFLRMDRARWDIVALASNEVRGSFEAPADGVLTGVSAGDGTYRVLTREPGALRCRAYAIPEGELVFEYAVPVPGGLVAVLGTSSDGTRAVLHAHGTEPSSPLILLVDIPTGQVLASYDARPLIVPDGGGTTVPNSIVGSVDPDARALVHVDPSGALGELDLVSGALQPYRALPACTWVAVRPLGPGLVAANAIYRERRSLLLERGTARVLFDSRTVHRKGGYQPRVAMYCAETDRAFVAFSGPPRSGGVTLGIVLLGPDGVVLAHRVTERYDTRAWCTTFTRDGAVLLVENGVAPSVRLTRFDAVGLNEQFVTTIQKPTAQSAVLPWVRHSPREGWLFVDIERTRYAAREGYLTSWLPGTALASDAR